MNKPCRKCGGLIRYASGKCVACNRAFLVAWRLANLGRSRTSVSAWAQANPEKRREKGRRWARANPEKHAENSLAYITRRKAAILHSQNHFLFKELTERLNES